MTVNVNDVLRCTLEMHYENFGAIQNVFHLRNEDVQVDDASAISDIIQVLTALQTIFGILIPVLQVVDGVRMINVTQGVDVGFGVFGDTTPFTGTGQVMPTQVAAGLNLTTARLNIVGRKYFGATIVDMCLSGGTLTPASIALFATAGQHMSTLFAATNTDWRYGVIASLDGVFLPFQSYSLPTMAVIQRRRRLGVGI